VIVGIDASNIRSGGGVTHLVNLLKCVDIDNNSVNHIVVWSCNNTIQQIYKHPKVIVVHVPILDYNLIFRMIWQRWLLPRQILKHNCNILFSPGGILPGLTPVPTVTLSQNLLPFESRERRRFPFFSFMRYKLLLIKIMQINSMQKTDGLIFLSDYACETILSFISVKKKFIVKIPHGIERRFFHTPKIDNKANGVLFKLLYVSTIDVYKHQWNVAEAVVELRKKNIPVSVDFIGGFYGPAKKRLLKYMKEVDPHENFLHYKGVVPFEKLHSVYASSNAFVFASSCENLPNILIEAMASGLPIACSNMGPMPEVLKECGLYFNPEDPHNIAEKLMKLIDNPLVTKKMSRCSYLESKKYSWERTTKETFDFIEKVYLESVNDIR
jgi:glycosyltransferase involved in cell wall biosynthesis